ncbi:hypothetical protein EXIGLDRAFT_838600 [Exidia glandulosa HHB12029]|uniref:Uncharacterized protein n=1 Tax=Exidia glandulosa HHB12029 TaxID=1314781 RepID=A0A165FQ47_EXIGL|nr:hypothetical protein EXIGLDRAFT_838600 [Exidia glandulosa HHB12029]
MSLRRVNERPWLTVRLRLWSFLVFLLLLQRRAESQASKGIAYEHFHAIRQLKYVSHEAPFTRMSPYNRRHGLLHVRLVIRPLPARTQNVPVEGRDPQATHACGRFARILGAVKITPDLLNQRFSVTIEFLVDVAVVAPAADALTAKMLYLSMFDEERVARLAHKIAVEGDPLVKPKDKLL